MGGDLAAARARGALLAALWVVLWPADAHAQSDSDGWRYRLDVDGAFTAYLVRTPATPVAFARRRLVQTAALDLSRDVGRERRVRVEGSLDVRLDQDFARVCPSSGPCIRDSDPAALRDYQALVDDGTMELRDAHVGLRVPGQGRLRLGRQLTWDPLGMVRFDGLLAEVSPTSWFFARAYVGQQVRGASFAGSPAFAPQGLARIDLPASLAPGAAPHVAPPSRTVVGGVFARFGSTEHLAFRVAYRQAADRSGDVARRFGVGATSRLHTALRLRGDLVFDLLDAQVIDAAFIADARVTRAVHVDARFERHVPRFDPGTIWGFFELVPVDRASAGARALVGATELTMHGQLRRARLGGDVGAELDGGLEASARTLLRATRVGLRAQWGRGDLGPIRGVFGDVSRPIGGRAEVRLWASAWHFQDALRAGLSGVSWHAGLGASTELTELATLQLRAEHSYNRYVGNRYRLTAALTLRVHR